MGFGVVLYGIFAVFFLVLGVIFFLGRGARLIAGYNTMPKEERARYDEKALCRFMGKLMFYCAVCMLLMGADKIHPHQGFGAAGMIWLAIGAVAAVIYANTGNRFLKKPPQRRTRRENIPHGHKNRMKRAAEGFRSPAALRWHALCPFLKQLRHSNRSEVSSFI